MLLAKHVYDSASIYTNFYLQYFHDFSSSMPLASPLLLNAESVWMLCENYSYKYNVIIPGSKINTRLVALVL